MIISVYEFVTEYVLLGCFIGLDDSFRNLLIVTFPFTAPAFLTFHNGWKFVTRDRDNIIKCAASSEGGWWMGQNACGFVHLNGDYNNQFRWFHYSLKSSEMKIRPIVPNP